MKASIKQDLQQVVGELMLEFPPRLGEGGSDAQRLRARNEYSSWLLINVTKRCPDLNIPVHEVVTEVIGPALDS